MQLACAIFVLLVGCGRIGFDQVSGSDGPDMADGPDTSGSDALGVANDDCMTAIDVTAGGTISGTTCGANDTTTSTCGVIGTPDLFYKVTLDGGTTVTIVVTPGFVIQQRILSCTGSGTCAAGMFSAGGGGTPGTYWYFAIEKEAGGCGAFTATFGP